MADEHHFRPLISMGMRYDLWIGPDAVRLKQGLRKLEIPLRDVAHFGVKRLPDDRTALTELRIATAAGKVHKLPFNTGDDAAKQALAALTALKPEADVSGLIWTEAAPLLGIEPYGLAQLLLHPLAGAGLAVVLLAPVALLIMNNLFPGTADEQRYRPIAMVIVMVIGVVMFFVGRRRFKAAQAAEQAVLAQRERQRSGDEGDRGA